MMKSHSTSQPLEQVKAPWWKKFGWMLLIWCASVLALLAVSMLFRMMMTAAGMKSH
ncbi:DUF2474 domain-containing protein [Yersinia vastinensis]|uniref:DUF2474 domain-containing protein n=1 Tax=Yersinia vastinensis TaxID=2890318 RepID=UPI0005E667A4|nr:DUF2474 domain-containing protein [Yersinia vastinensis]OVZ95568.1 DUF2474 domain-containing protein [Yersinia frederiksenii]CNJ02266.1 Protein of uncharacterised function (DUF2474) [Yersinia frederiksenii]CNL13272.1 Protein of uncharacterised function (DUF2474) [Yersinia frederiksenii]